MERLLGQGAMGSIYLARDPVIGRLVAIKLVRADLADGEDREGYMDRFRHEAQAAGRCSHPNIVAIYDFAVHEGNPFLAMEYVEGVPLNDALRRVGRFPPAEAVAIAGQVLDALEAAHAGGVVHRDIKPANILLTTGGQAPGGRVKVMDFGISRLDTSRLTMDGTVIGTPAYMSPEQCRGEAVDARGDLFSTGSVLYELLSGARPFPGRNVAEITHRLLGTAPPDIAAVVPGIPPGVAAALRRALEKAPEARFASAQAMAEALRRGMRDGGAGFDEERTVVLSPNAGFGRVSPDAGTPASATPDTATPDAATLSLIERRLAHHLGPIARRLVRDAATPGASAEAVCETVARGIADPAERARFLAEARNGSLSGIGGAGAGGSGAGGSSRAAFSTASLGTGGLGTGAAAGAAVPPGPLSPDRIERAERALTRHLGPIAKLLVKRALPGAASEAALWERLATHIEGAADRAVFLKQRPGG